MTDQTTTEHLQKPFLRSKENCSCHSEMFSLTSLKKIQTSSSKTDGQTNSSNWSFKNYNKAVLYKNIHSDHGAFIVLIQYCFIILLK